MMNIFVFVFVLILRARALEMKVIEIRFKSDLNPIQIAFHSNSQKKQLAKSKNMAHENHEKSLFSHFLFPLFFKKWFLFGIMRKKTAVLLHNSFFIVIFAVEIFYLKKADYV